MPKFIIFVVEELNTLGRNLCKGCKYIVIRILKNMYLKKSRSDPILSYLLTPTEIYRKIDNIN